jgi:hypothetical protein
MTHIRSAISRQYPPFLRSETAIQVYLLAQQHGLHHEAVEAARVALHFPITIEGLEAKLDSAGMIGAYLHELWKYHGQVRIELKSALLEFRDTGLPEDVKNLRCTRRPYGTASPLWLYDYINYIVHVVEGTPPRHLFDLTEFEKVLGRHAQSSDASYERCLCVTRPSQVRHSFWEALSAVVHRTMEKVRRIGVTTPHSDS